MLSKKVNIMKIFSVKFFTLFKGINDLVPALSIFLGRFWWNSVYISM